ncbi:MAG: alpha/beta hydrolase family esterase [Actinomycetota bacterium]
MPEQETGSEEGRPSGTYTLDVDGLTRDYIVHVPESPDPTALVILMHGYAGSASSIQASTEMDVVADEHGFVVAYPVGTSDDRGNAFFDVGYAFHDVRVDDVGFLRALAKHLVAEYGIDDQSIFVTGMSNGGDMAYLLACRGESWVRAYAAVAGALFEHISESCAADQRTPFLELHGTNDDVTWWDGDPDNRGGWGPYLGQLEAFTRLSGLYELSAYSESVLPTPVNDEGQPLVTALSWSSDRDGMELVLVRVDGGGHFWGGLGTSQGVWDFFERHCLTCR